MSNSQKMKNDSNRAAMKVDTVTTRNEPDEIGEDVVRYLDVRCPDCGRMFFCELWESNGMPSVRCPPCGRHHGWPFEEIEGLEHRYRHGEWPAGGESR